MCEVTRDNFEAVYPDLVGLIADAHLLAIDMEFTGIDLLPVSLFDDAEERYRRARASVSQTSLLQVGLAVFTKLPPDADLPHNTYAVRAFNFLLFPPAYPPLRAQFVAQPSAVAFLRQHGLDVNACVDRGISFLNARGEAAARRQLERRCDFLSGAEEEAVKARGAVVAQMLEEGGDCVRVAPLAGVDTAVLRMLLHDRFLGVWTEEDEGEVVVRRVSDARRRELEEAEKRWADGSLRRGFLLQLLGFTRIVRTIVNMKKPLVAHNGFVDMLHLYDKFIKPLPDDLETFKADFHRLLPNFFDTRVILRDGRARDPDLKNALSSTRSLADVFARLSGEYRTNHKLNITLPPHLHFVGESARYDGASLAHEAGFDAMMAGCVLLHLGHRMAFPPGENRSPLRPGQLNFEVYRLALLPFSNQVNVIQAAVDKIRLDPGPAPPTSKPPSLVVRRRDRQSAAFNLQQLQSLLDAFGVADLRPFGSGAALVRFNNFNSYRLLWHELKEDSDLCAETYSSLRHCPGVRRSVLGVALISTAVSGFAVSSLLVESWLMGVLTAVRPM